MTPPPHDLTLDIEEFAPLVAPVLLVALTGLFDVAGVATSALDHIADDERSVIVGEIDPDPFYDFTVERPTVEILDDDQRVLLWPSNLFRVVRTAAAHDLVVLSGAEPHLRWPSFVRCITSVVERLGVVTVVTLGSTADVTPHTRMPLVVGSTSDRSLARELALAAPTYQGVTGLIGVLHSALEASGIPSISLRVGVPHYLAMGEHPRAVTSLVLHTSHVVGVPLAIDLRDSIERWDEAHSASIAEDDKLRHYVEILEAEYDRRAEAAITPGDDLAASFEAFLRDGSGPRDDHPARGMTGDGGAGEREDDAERDADDRERDGDRERGGDRASDGGCPSGGERPSTAERDGEDDADDDGGRGEGSEP